MDTQNLAQLPHILVVDDDERLRALIASYLRDHGFLVTTAEDAAAARETLRYLEYDLIVMDVMMPGEDGFSFTKKWKEQKNATPVLLLTALGEVESRIEGLEAGADDYLPKPFEPRELVLRINAILKRVSMRPRTAEKTIRFGKWQVDFDRGELFDDKKERLPLTQAEQTLLKALSSRKGEAISREELADLCALDAEERTIDVQVTRLRKKIEEDSKMPRYLQTVRGKGYILWPDE